MSIQERNTSKIESTLMQRGIKRLFNNLPSASHQGGVWEWLIRSMRNILRATLRTHCLDEEGLPLFLCEAEAILNSCPITTPSNKPNNVEALTTNHFLLLRSNPSFSPGLFQEEDLQYMHVSDEGKSSIWWIYSGSDGLKNTYQKSKHVRVPHGQWNFAPGDVVLLVNESAPRNTWDIGSVMSCVMFQ